MSDFPEVKDHLVENPDKYTMTTNPDGTVTLRPTWVDNPAEVLQEGTPVNAAFLSKIPEAIDAIDTKVTSQLAETETQVALQKYFTTANEYGAVGDGVADDTLAIQTALNTDSDVRLRPGVYRVTDTIRVGPRGKSLIGLNDNVRDYGSRVIIKYDGPTNNRKPVILLGTNLVGAEPTVDASAVILKDIIVDSNNKAGFGIYGTYLTNETLVERVTAINSIEYNMYFAKSWYATFRDLVGIGCKGNGLAFGMPLEYLDGSSVTWSDATGLEINNCSINNIRSHSSGKHFSEDNPGAYNPTNAAVRRKGYGIGAGVGNSFMIDTFTSERSGGTGLYMYTSFQPLKTIRKGYMETNCLNSGLVSASTMPNAIIENTATAGGPIFLEDVFMNYLSGGIYHTGLLGRKVWLKNIQQPRFLKSLDGLTDLQLYAEVLKDEVYFDCGRANTLEGLATGTAAYQTVNTQFSFTVNAIPHKAPQLVMVKGDGTTPWGSYTITFEDGTTVSRSFPAGLGTTFVASTLVEKGIVSITKGGGTGGTASNVTFKVLNMPVTYN